MLPSSALSCRERTWRLKMELDIFNKIMTLLRNTDNDRTAGILAGVLIDETLTTLLHAVIIEDLPNELLDSLFGNNGTFGTFYNKAVAAFAFGLIDEEEFRLLNIVRSIRNKCAHDIASDPVEDFSFSKSPLIDILREWIPEKWINLIPEAERQEFTNARMMITPESARFFFIYLVAFISLTLYIRIATSERRIQPPSQLDREDSSKGST